MAASLVMVRELRGCKVLLVGASGRLKMLESSRILILIIVACGISSVTLVLLLMGSSVIVVERWRYEVGIAVGLRVIIVVILGRSSIRLEAAGVLAIEIAHVEGLTSSAISAELSGLHHEDLFKLILELLTSIANIVWGNHAALVVIE